MAAQKTKMTGARLPLPLQFLAAWLAVWLGRVLQEQVDYLKAENRLLRERLGMKQVRLTDAERRRQATLGKAWAGRDWRAGVATIASPETILRWYRELVAKNHDGSRQRPQGRPKTAAEIEALVVGMARENTWGTTRLMGALKNLGYKVGRNTIKRILQEHGIEPASERGRRMPWARFIKAHLGVIVGMDFFTVEVVTWLGLIRYHVLFAIDIASRRVEVVGIAANPGGPWMEQMARNLVDAVDGFLVGKRYVLVDRDPLYTEGFRKILGQGGVKAVRLPARSPNLNAFAERFVLSIKTECLDRLVPLGEAHLRRAVLEYTKHYHEERNHQGLDNELILPSEATKGLGRVDRRERLGGLLSFYHRKAG